MKKTIIKVMCAILLMAIAMSAVACGSNTIYDDLAEQGYTVRVRFNVGEGGLVNDTQSVTIVEAYNAADAVTVGGKTGIRLLAPDDPIRGEGAFKISYNTADTYYLPAGWYTSRTEVAPGQYTYSGPWNFATDLVDPNTLENGEMTLYAAWIPFFTYEFYAQNESGSFVKVGEKGNKLDLTLPKWNEKKAQWDMKDLKEIPVPEGKIFAGAYLDEAMISPVNDKIDGDNLFVDYQTGTATQSVIKVYITWTDAVA